MWHIKQRCVKSSCEVLTILNDPQCKGASNYVPISKAVNVSEGLCVATATSLWTFAIKQSFYVCGSVCVPNKIDYRYTREIHTHTYIYVYTTDNCQGLRWESVFNDSDEWKHARLYYIWDIRRSHCNSQNLT